MTSLSDEGTTRVFTSTIGPPLSDKNAGPPPAPQIPVSPTTWPVELALMAVLHGQVGRFPRSVITPFFQRNAWCDWEPTTSALPTTNPESVIHHASELSPPKVPRSVNVPAFQRNPWLVASPARF